MDFDAGPVLEGRCSQDEMAQKLLKMVEEVASGTKSKSEALGHKEYFIPYKYQDRDVIEKCREAWAMFDTGSYFSLEGQTAIVTGGSTGLGLAITRCMVGEGAKVAVLSYESREQGREALKSLGKRLCFISLTSRTQTLPTFCMGIRPRIFPKRTASPSVALWNIGVSIHPGAMALTRYGYRYGSRIFKQ